MIIPEKLKVEGHIFDVKWVDGKDLDDDDDDKSLTYADVDRAELTIRLRNNGVKKSVMEESFFHEIIHLCDSETHPMSHKLVDDIARRLYALLKENNLLNND
jgi:hypothetical protein